MVAAHSMPTLNVRERPQPQLPRRVAFVPRTFAAPHLFAVLRGSLLSSHSSLPSIALKRRKSVKRQRVILVAVAELFAELMWAADDARIRKQSFYFFSLLLC